MADNAVERRLRQAATIGAAVVALLIPCAARAQTDLQLWGNFTFDWIKDHRITMGVDAEPKVLLVKPSGDPEWATLDITPSFEYRRGEWFDMIGELMVGRTKQIERSRLHGGHASDWIPIPLPVESARGSRKRTPAEASAGPARPGSSRMAQPVLLDRQAERRRRSGSVIASKPSGRSTATRSPTTARRPWRPTGSGSSRWMTRPSGSPTFTESEPASPIATASRGGSQRCMSGTVPETPSTSPLQRATMPST